MFQEQVKSLALRYWSTHSNIMAASLCPNIRELTLTFAHSTDLVGTNVWEEIGKSLVVLNLELRDDGELGF